MIFLFIIVAMIAAGLIAHVASDAKFKRIHHASRKELSGSSWASKELVKEYYNIPEHNRPYANIKAVVKALDTKYDVAEVNSHFRRRGYKNSYPAWDCGCYSTDRCRFGDYKTLRVSFKSIVDALADQQYQLALSAVEDGLNEAGTLMDRLREEKNLITQVTKELTHRD